MPGPGEYPTRPPPRASPASRTCPSPRSAARAEITVTSLSTLRPDAYRDRLVRRTLHDLGNPLTGRPRELIVIYSQHCCTRCRKYFNADMTDLAAPGSHYTKSALSTRPSAWSSRTAYRIPSCQLEPV